MIDIKTLRKTDTGRWVEYCPSCGPTEKGRIKSWNEQYIFVVYKCGGDWINYENYTGAATKPGSLNFVMKGEKIVTLRQLRQAVCDKRAITVPGTTFNEPCPAAWIINLQGHLLYQLFTKGMYVYEKESEENHD